VEPLDKERPLVSDNILSKSIKWTEALLPPEGDVVSGCPGKGSGRLNEETGFKCIIPLGETKERLSPLYSSSESRPVPPLLSQEDTGENKGHDEGNCSSFEFHTKRILLSSQSSLSRLPQERAE